MKRRWFQIHLSTAVVMMVVAGGWLLATLLMRTYFRSVLWTDDERISPVSLRSSDVLNVWTFALAGLGLMVLLATLVTLERRIRRREAPKA
jgi:hypothetical protein